MSVKSVMSMGAVLILAISAAMAAPGAGDTKPAPTTKGGAASCPMMGGDAKGSGGCSMMGGAAKGKGSCSMMGGTAKGKGSCPMMGGAAKGKGTCPMMGGKSSAAAAKGAVTCPVMGGKVANPKTAPKSVYKGKTYYFCCAACKPKFDKDPAKYLAKK